MSGAFEVRVLDVESRRVESGSFDLEPAHEQAAKVVELMRAFMGGRPGAFRERLPFMNQGEWALEWNAAAGGVAFAALQEGRDPVSLCLLLSGRNPEVDAGMAQGFEQAVAGPMTGGLTEAERERLLGGAGARAVVLVLPGRPELGPALQLLNAALGAVFFRAVALAGDG